MSSIASDVVTGVEDTLPAIAAVAGLNPEVRIALLALPLVFNLFRELIGQGATHAQAQSIILAAAQSVQPAAVAQPAAAKA